VAALLAARRLLHELRDIARDQIAHPERPLPSARTRPDTIWKWVGGLGALSLALAIALSLMQSAPWPAVAVAVCAALLWLSLREFYLGETLPESPAMRTFAHALIAFPLSALAIAAGGPEAVFAQKGLGYALGLYGSAVALSFSRTLDPKAHPAWPTILAVHGRLGAFVFILAASAGSAWGARLAGAARVLGVFEWALVVLSALALLKPSFSRFAGAFGALSFLAHAWAGPLVLLAKSWSLSNRW
jgi:hypothetical protein